MNNALLAHRYQVQQQLSKNAGRQTLIAYDLQAQAMVAIKLISFGQGSQWEDFKLFEREAQTLKSLSHPAIPRYLDFFELNSPEEAGFALVQTFVEGKSLDVQIRAGRNFNEDDIIQIAKEVLEILIYLHGRQPPVIHRDIKPSNILLTNRSGHSIGDIYLVDFGSVQTLAAAEGQTVTVVGTYGYMPLEQFGGRAVPASDLYSLGATLIYLVTGIHPADLPQTNGRIQFAQIANLSPSFTRWLRRMTEPNADRRFASAEAALNALEQMQRSLETSSDIVPVAAQKPASPKVLLTKNDKFIEIVICPANFDSQTALKGAIAILFVSLVLRNIVIFGIAGYLWLPALFAAYGKARLLINQRHISLTYELFGFTWGRKTASRRDIQKLVYQTRTWGKYNRSKIIISTGNYQYKLPSDLWFLGQLFGLPINDTLNPAEIEWLIQELSEWLELPINRK